MGYEELLDLTVRLSHYAGFWGDFHMQNIFGFAKMTS